MLALTRMGQFDQAIACWHRVEQAKPGDEEAQQAISRLAVEKTIHKGGYDPALLGGDGKGGSTAAGAKPLSVARWARPAENADGEEDEQTELPLEERLKAAIAKDPAALDAYFRLADIYIHQNTLDEAQAVLDRANQAAGGGNFQVRERLEDIELRRCPAGPIRPKALRARANAGGQEAPRSSPRQANQVELRCTPPGPTAIRTTRGCSSKLACGSRRLASRSRRSRALQAARGDSKRKALVLLELGECFQKIEQYKLALAHYEQSSRRPTPATRKRVSWPCTAPACWPLASVSWIVPNATWANWRPLITGTGTWPTDWTKWPRYAIVVDSLIPLPEGRAIRERFASC